MYGWYRFSTEQQCDICKADVLFGMQVKVEYVSSVAFSWRVYCYPCIRKKHNAYAGAEVAPVMRSLGCRAV